MKNLKPCQQRYCMQCLQTTTQLTTDAGKTWTCQRCRDIHFRTQPATKPVTQHPE